MFDSSQYLRAYYFSTFQLQVGRDYHKLRPLPSFLNFQLLFLQARGLLIYPHILTSIPDISIVPSRVVWLLMVIKLGYIFMASSSILYSSYSEDLGFTSCFFTGCSRYLQGLRIPYILISIFFLLYPLTRGLSRWLYVQVGYFSHRRCPESIIPYQLLVFTQLNPYVGSAPLGRYLLCASVIQHNYPSILLGI